MNKPASANMRRATLAAGTLCLVLAACGEDTPAPAAGLAPVSVEASTRPAPRYDDGRIRLDRVAGEKGYWGRPGAASLVERGVQVRMDENGLLENIEDAGQVAPFQAWALALYKYRQGNGLQDDPVHTCISPAGPRHLHTAGGFRIIQDRNYNRVYLLFGGGNRNWRLIFLDGRTPPDPEEVVGTFHGHSTGRWEGDTLVVESSGFNSRFWFSNGGLPHTEALRLTERFTRSAHDRLNYQVTIDDPFTYTRPWTSEWTLEWIADGEIKEQFCEQ